MEGVIFPENKESDAHRRYTACSVFPGCLWGALTQYIDYRVLVTGFSSNYILSKGMLVNLP